MARNLLIFDTDGGVDDAQALVMLIANGVVPDAITTVFGNVGLDLATNNMLATLATLGVGVPLHKGADRPLAQPIIDAKYVHGEDGLGGAPRPARISVPASSDAIGFLRTTFRTDSSSTRSTISGRNCSPRDVVARAASASVLTVPKTR